MLWTCPWEVLWDSPVSCLIKPCYEVVFEPTFRDGMVIFSRGSRAILCVDPHHRHFRCVSFPLDRDPHRWDLPWLTGFTDTELGCSKPDNGLWGTKRCMSAPKYHYPSITLHRLMIKKKSFVSSSPDHTIL